MWKFKELPRSFHILVILNEEQLCPFLLETFDMSGDVFDCHNLEVGGDRVGEDVLLASNKSTPTKLLTTLQYTEQPSYNKELLMAPHVKSMEVMENMRWSTA